MQLPLEQLKEFCKKEGISYMTIFGSFANDTARPDSDVDILVSFHNEQNIGLLHFIDVKNKLSDLLGKNVNLVSRDALNPKIKKYVLSSLKEIFNDVA